MLRGTYVAEDSELAGPVPKNLIRKAAAHVREWREFAVNKNDNINVPVACVGEPTYSWDEYIKDFLPRGAYLRSLSLAAHNPQLLADEHDSIYNAICCHKLNLEVFNV